MAATGVDYVKIGLFPGGEAAATIARLGACSLSAVPARRRDARGPRARFRTHRATCAARALPASMLDTAGKDGGHAARLPDRGAARAFVAQAQGGGLFAGLAGSLRRGSDCGAAGARAGHSRLPRRAVCEGSERKSGHRRGRAAMPCGGHSARGSRSVAGCAGARGAVRMTARKPEKSGKPATGPAGDGARPHLRARLGDRLQHRRLRRGEGRDAEGAPHGRRLSRAGRAQRRATTWRKCRRTPTSSTA